MAINLFENRLQLVSEWACVCVCDWMAKTANNKGKIVCVTHLAVWLLIGVVFILWNFCLNLLERNKSINTNRSTVTQCLHNGCCSRCPFIYQISINRRSNIIFIFLMCFSCIKIPKLIHVSRECSEEKKTATEWKWLQYKCFAFKTGTNKMASFNRLKIDNYVQVTLVKIEYTSSSSKRIEKPHIAIKMRKNIVLNTIKIWLSQGK